MMTRRLHVLYFTGQFPYPNDPSRCIFASHLARAIEDSAKVTVVCPVPYAPALAGRLNGRYATYAGVPSEAQVHGQLVHYPKFISLPRSPRRWVPKAMASGVRRCVSEIHRSNPIDLVHCRWLYPDGVAATQIAQWLNVPVVLTAMGCDANEYIENRQMGPLIKSSLRSANALTGVSRPLTDILAHHSANSTKCFYTPNGVDIASFKAPSQSREQARDQLQWAESFKDILYVGRFADEKNVHLLLNSFAKLKADPQFAQTRLWLAGDGPLAGSLAQLKAQLKLDDCHFLGQVAHAELSTYFKAATVVALSSDREGMPNAVIEALALGTPVVATAVGAIPDLLNEANGIVSPLKNPVDFARNLATALTRRWDHAAIAKSMSRTWQQAAGDYLSVYEYALAGKQGTF